MLMPSIFERNLFDDFMNDFSIFNDREIQKMSKSMMKTDIKEHDTGYELEMELPGFKKDEVQVSLENGYLNIRAAKNVDKDEQDKESGAYIRRERYAGVCERSFYVGEDITEDDIKGEFKHGILKLMIPKQDVKPAVETKKYIALEG